MPVNDAEAGQGQGLGSGIRGLASGYERLLEAAYSFAEPLEVQEG